MSRTPSLPSADPFAELRRARSEHGYGSHRPERRSRLIRLLGTVLIAAGLCVIAWTVVVWRWQDPFTALYTTWKQQQLAGAYEKRVDAFAPTTSPTVAGATGAATPDATSPRDRQRQLASVAAQYRRSTKRGEPIARIRIPRLGLNMVVVNGTDTDSLKKGPGLDPRTYMPGEGKLVYIAGHRTTYLAPFSHIAKLRPGDRVTLELPYATVVYAVTGHRIVRADYIKALNSRGREEIALQACWPRFFATHRYIVYGKPVQVIPRLAALKE